MHHLQQLVSINDAPRPLFASYDQSGTTAELRRL
jgi:hypothetical protein